MLLSDLQPTDYIEEGVLTRAVGAAALVLTSLLPNSGQMANHSPKGVDVIEPASPIVAQASKRHGGRAEVSADHMIKVASAKYKVDPKLVKQVVNAAIKYQDPVFPRAEHILSVIGVESSFKPNAVSALKSDPAIGLMQQRPRATGVSPEELSTIDGQIKNGVALLKQYYKRVGNDANAALHAYNVGIGNHKKSLKDPSKGNPRYAPKVNRELAMYQLGNAKTGTTTTR